MRRTAPLARGTLARIALRLIAVVCLTTGLGFWHAFETFRETYLQNMERNLKLRLERENTLFSLAEDNLLLLRDRFVAALAEPPPADLDAAFALGFETKADGTTRHILAGFDPHRLAGGYVTRNLPITPEIKHRLLVQQDMATHYGQAWEARFANTYIASLDGVFATFLPNTDWATAAPPEVEKEIRDYPWVKVASMAEDPARRPAWTGVYLDAIARQAGAKEYYYITCTVPIDVDGRFAHYAGLDISVDSIIRHNEESIVPGGWNLIFSRKGQLIAHPAWTEQILQRDGDFLIPRDGDVALRDIWRQIVDHGQPDGIIHDTANRQYLGYSLLPDLGWYFVTVLPETAVTSVAWQVAQVLLALGGLSFLLELLLFRRVLRRQVELPLQSIVEASTRLAGGDWEARLEPQANQELDTVASAFNSMAEALAARDGIIRRHVQELGSLVSERTAELRAVFDSGPAPMFLIAGDRIIDANKASEHMFGHARADLVRLGLPDLMPASYRGKPIDPKRIETLRHGGARRLELPMRRADGTTFWGLLSTAQVDPNRPELGCVMLCEDISERLAREEETTHKAQHDALTSLPNRVLFEDRLTRALAGTKGRDELVGLLFVDLDRFKAVNDIHGHDAGDFVLRECAHRLKGALRQGDLVARWGGDEFIVLLPELHATKHAAEAAARIIAALGQPFEWLGNSLGIGASIGIAIAPTRGYSPESLLRGADRAMYQAKLAGGDRWVFSSGDGQADADVHP